MELQTSGEAGGQGQQGSCGVIGAPKHAPVQSSCRDGRPAGSQALLAQNFLGGGKPNCCLVPPPPGAPGHFLPLSSPQEPAEASVGRRTKLPSCPAVTLNSEPHLPAECPLPAQQPAKARSPGQIPHLDGHSWGFSSTAWTPPTGNASTNSLTGRQKQVGGGTPRASPPLPSAKRAEGWHHPGAFWKAGRQSVRTLCLPLAPAWPHRASLGRRGKVTAELCWDLAPLPRQALP